REQNRGGAGAANFRPTGEPRRFRPGKPRTAPAAGRRRGSHELPRLTVLRYHLARRVLAYRPTQAERLAPLQLHLHDRVCRDLALAEEPGPEQDLAGDHVIA